MNFPRALLILSLLAAASVFAQEDERVPPPTWDEVIAGGVLPYRQLKLEDIPVNDAMRSQGAFRMLPTIEPRFHVYVTPGDDEFHAHINQWYVFSGLDAKNSFRKSGSESMSAELAYAQALLDLNEIHARKLAALTAEQLPQATAKTPLDAKAAVEQKLKEFLDQKLAERQAEMKAFATATKNGQDRKKVTQLAGDIRKRLEATPAATVPYLPPAGATKSNP